MLTSFAPLRGHGTVEIRLHREPVYSDLCFTDERMLVGDRNWPGASARIPDNLRSWALTGGALGA